MRGSCGGIRGGRGSVSEGRDSAGGSDRRVSSFNFSLRGCSGRKELFLDLLDGRSSKDHVYVVVSTSADTRELLRSTPVRAIVRPPDCNNV